MGFFPLRHRFQTGFGAHPASYIQWARWEVAVFPGIKRPGREADHSPPPNAEFRNMCFIFLLATNTLRTNSATEENSDSWNGSSQILVV